MDQSKNANTQDECTNEERKRPHLSEAELKTETVEDVKPKIIRAFCPKCGREIKSTAPTMFKPFNFERVCIYDCECGMHAELDHAYPRVVFVDKDGNEYDAYAH